VINQAAAAKAKSRSYGRRPMNKTIATPSSQKVNASLGKTTSPALRKGGVTPS
jgi:hypothetical protein